VTLEDPAQRTRETKIAGLIKGETACNREACQTRLILGQRWWNVQTLAFYCRGCAHRINRLALSSALDKLCIPESEKPR
jgi:hypothetical protein